MPDPDPRATQLLDRAASLLYLPVRAGLADLTARFSFRFHGSSDARDLHGTLRWKTPRRFGGRVDEPIDDAVQGYVISYLANVAALIERPYPLRSLRGRPAAMRTSLVADDEVLLAPEPDAPPLPRSPRGAANDWKRKIESRLRFDAVGTLREVVTKGELWDSWSTKPVAVQTATFTYEASDRRHLLRSFTVGFSWVPMRFRFDFSYQDAGGFQVPARIAHAAAPDAAAEFEVHEEALLSDHAVNTGIGLEGLEPLPDEETAGGP